MNAGRQLARIQSELDAIQIEVSFTLTKDGVIIRGKNQADRLIAKMELKKVGLPILSNWAQVT